MQTSTPRSVSVPSLLLACMAVIVPLALLGCSTAEPEPTPPPTGEVPVEGDQAVRFPEPEYTDLSTPEEAVRTYLAWISHAYRI